MVAKNLKLLPFLIFINFPSFTQPTYDQLPVESLTMEDGLLNNHINAIYQDNKGFIWIGTKEGLNKYDGINFIEYSHNPNDTTSISANVITKILEDQFGHIWVGTTRGLNRLSFDQKGFIKYKSKRDKNSKFGSNIISEIYEDSDKQLWIGSGDGSLHLYKRAEDSFISFPVANKAELRAIKEGPDDTLILGYGAWVLEQGKGGILFFDKRNHTFIQDSLELLSGNFSVTNIVAEDATNIWISTYNTGLYKYNIKTGDLQTYDVKPGVPGHLNSDLLFGIYKDQQGILWIATDGGSINWYNKETGRFTQYKNTPSKKGLKVLAITSIFEDRDGLFWIGTVNDGINILNKYKRRIRHLSYGDGNKNGLSGKSVLALAESKDGGIWIGFDHGSVNYLNSETQLITHYLYNPADSNSVSDDVINGLYESKSGELFIGTYLNGFDILNEQRNQLTHYGVNNAIKNATYIKCFYEDRIGAIWIGSRKQGLIRFDRKTNIATNFKHDPDNPNSINHNHIAAILEENDKSLWIGTFNGLNLIDIESGTIKSWEHVENDLNSLSGIQVYALCKDKNGGLWIGTDNGLNYYDRLKDNFHHFTTADGLPSNTIKGILNDEANNLWISTNRGLSRFSISKMEFKNFGLEDGVLGLEFNENSALKTSDGKILFGSTNGISYFYSKDITSNPLVPPIIITNFLIANKPVKIGAKNSPLRKQISDTKSLTLTHKHSVFTFEFFALNYTSPQKNQYAYMLEGFDEKWNYVGTQHNATYTNINAGKYIFRVKAANNDGIWNEEGVALEVIILPPWWKTWWAFSIYMFVFAIAGLGARKAALTRIKLMNDLKLERLAKEKENEINQIKLKFFTNLSHEFKTPLTLILGPLERIISSNYGDAVMKKQFSLMYRNAGRLLRLINQLMDFRKINQSKMTLMASKVELISFIKVIVENFQLMADNRNIKLHFKTKMDSQYLWIDEEKIDKVLYNLLSNAFNFTRGGDKITVSVDMANKLPDDRYNPQKKKPKFIAITVSDTGLGISEENLKKIFERFYQIEQKGYGTGIGLSLSKSLIQLQKGELFVLSKLGKGSKFIVHLPLGKEYLEESEIVTKSIDAAAKSYRPLIPQYEQFDENPNPVIYKNDKELTLLIVDDNPDVRIFLNESLKENYNIIEATDGKQGLKIAGENNIDLVISDIMMPQMDGLEFCFQMKSHINTSHIPIILLTAKTEEKDIMEGLHIGADEYVTKPFSINLLEARIKNLIESRTKLKERFKHKLELEPGDIAVTKIDDKFLKEVVEIIEKNMVEQDFNIEVLLKEMGMSRSHLFRKIKSLIGQSPNDFINTIRYKNAAKLLLSGGLNVSEVAFKIGYATTKNFRNGFKKHFGKTPSEYVRENRNDLSRLE